MSQPTPKHCAECGHPLDSLSHVAACDAEQMAAIREWNDQYAHLPAAVAAFAHDLARDETDPVLQAMFSKAAERITQLALDLRRDDQGGNTSDD